jgi:hypothetical protein
MPAEKSRNTGETEGMPRGFKKLADMLLG